MVQIGLLKLELGESVMFEDTEYFISQISDLTHAILIHPKTRALKEVSISEISGVTEAKPTSDLDLIPSEHWDEAMLRYEIIKPLLVSKRTRALVEERAKQYGRSPTTLYQWIKRYEESGKVTELLRGSRSDKGEVRLSEEISELLNGVIKTEYKTQQKKSITKVHRELKRLTRDKGLQCPHYNTLRKWINKEHPKELQKLREGNKNVWSTSLLQVIRFNNGFGLR